MLKKILMLAAVAVVMFVSIQSYLDYDEKIQNELLIKNCMHSEHSSTIILVNKTHFFDLGNCEWVAN
ncbi:hypothetical protein K0U27_00765 [archaeon]|nr:hypothetical protein [archaeon]